MPDLSTVVNMFFGADNNKVLYALIILVTLDYITGVCVAIKDKKLSSSIGAKGIINKVVIFIMVSLSHVVDSYLLSSGVALERITILFYCANEAISILENAGKILYVEPCHEFSISIIFYCQYDIWDNFYHPPLEAFFACSCIVELNWISPNKTSSARRRLSGSFCNIDITS